MVLQLEMSFPRLQQDSVTQREGRTENPIGPEFLKHFMNILLKKIDNSSDDFIQE